MLKKIKLLDKKYFISIGAGDNQISLIKAAKKLGYHVISVDRNNHAPGFSYSNIEILESTQNPEDIYHHLEEISLNGEIVGIASKSFGLATLTTAQLAEKLEIPFIPVANVKLFLNKKLMKEIFTQNEIPTPEYKIIKKKIAKNKIPGYPLVIKPCEGHAKTGVQLLTNQQELDDYLQNNSSECLLEEYISGDEIIVFGIVQKGKFYLIDITDKVTTKEPYFVDLMHISPSKYFKDSMEIINIGNKIASAFAIDSAPLIFEMRIDKNNQFQVIEAAPEFGGEFISDCLIPSHLQYNYLQQTIRSITKNHFQPFNFNKKLKNYGAVKYITGSKGYFESFQKLNSKKNKGLVHYQIFKQKDDEIKEPTCNHDRIGVVICLGKTKNEALSNAESAISNLKIKIKENKDERS